LNLCFTRQEVNDPTAMQSEHESNSSIKLTESLHEFVKINRLN
jgi:hypothetical protein